MGEAEAIAIAALSAIAADPQQLSRFLAVTGLEPDTLRAAAGEPSFLSAVTGFLMADEPSLLAFAANEGLEPQAVAAAHGLLAQGGAETTP